MRGRREVYLGAETSALHGGHAVLGERACCCRQPRWTSCLPGGVPAPHAQAHDWRALSTTPGPPPANPARQTPSWTTT